MCHGSIPGGSHRVMVIVMQAFPQLVSSSRPTLLWASPAARALQGWEGGLGPHRDGLPPLPQLSPAPHSTTTSHQLLGLRMCREGHSPWGTWALPRPAALPYLHDLCMRPGAGHQGHEQLLVHPGEVITEHCLPRGMFQARQVHDRAAHRVLGWLLRVHSLQGG